MIYGKNIRWHTEKIAKVSKNLAVCTMFIKMFARMVQTDC